MKGMFWTLDADGQPVEAENQTAWAEWMAANPEPQQIGRTGVDGGDVSTIFLAINYSHGGPTPVLFETMVFGGDHDRMCQRYCTRAAAEAGHAAIVDALRNGRDPYEAVSDATD